MRELVAQKINKWLKGRPAAALAESVSLCVRVEPELLRAARYKLHPELTVDAESAIWFSPLVEARNPLGLVFRPEALIRLRDGLAADKSHLKKAWEIVEEHHRGITPAVALEERLTWLALSEPAPGPLWDLWNKEIERSLQSLLAALVREDRRGLVSWATRALPLLPELPRHRELLNDVAQAAMLRGAPRISLAGTTSTSQTPGWLVPKDGLARVAVEFTYVNVQPIVGKLRFFYPAPSNMPGLDAPGGKEVEVTVFPVSGPAIAANQTQLRVEYRKLEELPTNELQVRIRVTGGREYLVSAIERPRQDRRIFLGTGSSELYPLGHFVSYHLALEGYDVYWSQRTSPPPAPETIASEIVSRDIFVYIGQADPTTYQGDDELNIAREACLPILWLRTGLATGYAEAISVGDEGTWPAAVKALIEKLKRQPARLGELYGVPELPKPYLPRPQLLKQLSDTLLDPAITMVVLDGPRAAGQRTLAIALARSCEIRRRLPGGIRWPHDASSWAEVGSPQLYIVESPDLGHYNALIRTAESYRNFGSRILVIRAEVDRFQSSPALRIMRVPYLDVSEMMSGLQQIAGTGVWADPSIVAKVTEGWPERIVNAGLLWRAAEKSPQFATLSQNLIDTFTFQSPGANDPRLYTDDEVVAHAREFLPHTTTVCSLAAFKPDTAITSAAAAFLSINESALAEALKMLESCELLKRSTEGDFTLDRRIPVLLSESDEAHAAEAALVQTYFDRNGGDWIAGLGDTYFANALVFHLARLGMTGVIQDLLLELDYIEARTKGDPNVLLKDLDQAGPNVEWASEYSAPFSALSSRYGRSSITRLMVQYPFKSPELQVLRNQIVARSLIREAPPKDWVLVVGTSSYELPQPVLWASRALGRELARHGLGLVTGGWQGVDYVTADEYVKELWRIRVSPERAVLHVVRRGSKPDFPLGSVIDTDEVEGAIAYSRAVVAIGGQGATLDICKLASARGVLVMPIAGTGGDADLFYSLINPSAQTPIPLTTQAEGFQTVKKAVRAMISKFGPGLNVPK